MSMMTSQRTTNPVVTDSEFIPKGYKRTGIGIIPNDWDEVRLGTLANILRGASPRPIDSPVWFDENSSVGWLRISDVSSSGKYLNETAQNLSSAGISKSRFIKQGNLVMSICATVGRPIITRKNVCIHDGFVVFDSLKVDKEYLYYILTDIERKWAKYGQTGSQMNLNTSLIKSTFIPLPSNKIEQRAVANTLSDVDEMIEALDKLIAKQRAIKQGIIQQLLTGKTRLPGFHEEWKMFNLSADSILKARIGWQGLTTNEYLKNGDYYLVTGTDFQNGRVNWANCWFVDEKRYKQDKNIQLKLGDVLLTKDGTIGKVGYVDSLPGPATLNSGVFVIRPKNDRYDPLFLYYVLTSQIFESFLVKLQAGSTISHLYQKDFANFSFLAPKMPEQQAISSILSDIDAEIEAIERRRDKVKEIKQGMMQFLLMGKIRLINFKQGTNSENE